MNADTLLLCVLMVFLFAGTIKGLVGIGLPTATISILSQFIDPRHAIALLIFPAIVTNAWQVYRSRYFTKGIKELWPFASMLAVTIWIFALFAAHVSTDDLVFGVGLVIVVFVLTSLMAKPIAFPKHIDRPLQLFAGATAGIMGGLTSIWSPPMVIYLLARRQQSSEFVGASGFLILSGTLPLLAGYWQAGLITPALAGQSALMIVPTLFGFAIGEKLRTLFKGDQFRHAVLAIFLLMGMNLIRKAFVY